MCVLFKDYLSIFSEECSAESHHFEVSESEDRELKDRSQNGKGTVGYVLCVTSNVSDVAIYFIPIR